MDESTQFYFDVIKEQFEKAKSRLSPIQLADLVENLNDVIVADEDIEEEDDNNEVETEG